MAKFRVSVIVDNKRFVDLEVESNCMYGAFLVARHKYKPLHRYDVVYKCHYRGKDKYFNVNGCVIV